METRPKGLVFNRYKTIGYLIWLSGTEINSVVHATAVYMVEIYSQNQRRTDTVNACWFVQSEIISDKSPSLIQTNSTRLSQRYIVNVQSDMSVQKITTKHRHGPRADHFPTHSLGKFGLYAQCTRNLSMIELCRPFAEGIYRLYTVQAFSVANQQCQNTERTCNPHDHYKIILGCFENRAPLPQSHKWRALLLATLQAYFVTFHVIGTIHAPHC